MMLYVEQIHSTQIARNDDFIGSVLEHKTKGISPPNDIQM